MAERCSHCGSADIVAMGQAFSCLDCNQQTEYGGQAEQRTAHNGATYSVDPAGEAPAVLVPSDLEPAPESEPEPAAEAS